MSNLLKLIVFAVMSVCCALSAAENVPPSVAQEQAPRLEVTAGFASCGVYLNRTDKQECASATVAYREVPDGQWQKALGLTFDEESLQGRTVVAYLKEGQEYEARVTLPDRQDSQSAETPSVRFTTKSANVPVAETVVLQETAFDGHLRIQRSGTPDGYIRYTAAPGAVLAGDGKSEAILIDGAEYVILENLTVRGGKRDAIALRGASHVRIVNCDIASYGTVGEQLVEKGGKYYDDGGKRINNHAGIRMDDSRDVLVERCFIHSPNGRANSWFYSHPEGPNAVYAGGSAGVTLRYNDFVGSDGHRWNDVVESRGNGYKDGGMFRDAEVYGNYFAFGNDDGIELDGGQINARVWGNRIEGTLCGISTAPCLSGPSFIFENLVLRPGEEFGFRNVAIKNNYGKIGAGKIHLVNNTLVGEFSGISGFAKSDGPIDAGRILLMTRNNVLDVAGSYFASSVFPYGADLDYDLLSPRNTESERFALLDAAGYASHRMTDKPRYRNASADDYRLEDGFIGTVVDNLNPDGHVGIRDLPPLRPDGFTADTGVVDLSVPEGKATVKVRAVRQDQPQAFTILRPYSSDYFSVTPEEGILEPGRELALTVALVPGHIREARRHAGAFLIRTADGYSRPVAVYFENRRNLDLVKEARKDVVYGSVEPAEDGGVRLVFDLPEACSRYLFALVESCKGSVDVSVNGAEPEKRIIFRPDGDGARWCNVGASTYSGEFNPPIPLAKGTNVILLKPRMEGNIKIRQTALAITPEELLLAPYELAGP